MKTEAIDAVVRSLKELKIDLCDETSFERAATVRSAYDMIEKLRKRSATAEEMEEDCIAKRIDIELKALDVTVAAARDEIRRGLKMNPDAIGRIYERAIRDMGG